MSAYLPLKATDLVAFDNAAAGHDGVMSDVSGAVIIKPCTSAEISFYESARATHPEFASYMPTFMGTLTLSSSSDQNVREESGLEGSKTSLSQAIADPAITPAIAEAITQAIQDNTTTPNEKIPDEIPPIQPASTIRPWKEGGKKLDTDLAIVLENITAGFIRPNILDVKLGSQLWDHLASLEKRNRLDKVAAETTSASLGFRVAGMKVWEGLSGSQSEPTSTSKTSIVSPPAEEEEETDNNTHEGNVSDKVMSEEGRRDGNGYRDFGKQYGKKLTPENVSEAFKTFLFVDSAGVDHDLGITMVKRFLDDLKGLRKMLEKEESRMFSASILFVYEGDGEALRKALQEEKKKEEGGKTASDGQGVEVNDEEGEEDEDEEEEEEESLKVHDLKLIDFAHASWTPGLGPDENALKGVRSVERILEDFSKAEGHPSNIKESRIEP
ncbi:MAG: hypothetical protein M1823_004720 [Watsoniomyces obsoletus]|nr:MAG: hypothetical protein M1823_004720 [Watsoniomyces obsoletus]